MQKPRKARDEHAAAAQAEHERVGRYYAEQERLRQEREAAEQARSWKLSSRAVVARASGRVAMTPAR
jgi:hypothetical protein